MDESLKCLQQIVKNYNHTFEANNIAGSKINVPPAYNLPTVTQYRTQQQAPCQQGNQLEAEGPIHKNNSASAMVYYRQLENVAIVRKKKTRTEKMENSFIVLFPMFVSMLSNLWDIFFQ